MVSSKQTITVVCEPDDGYNLPRMSLRFHVAADSKGRSLVEQGFVTLLDREVPSLKEYALPDTGIYIYFSGSMEKKDDKIVSILVKEIDTQDDDEDAGHAELLAFLELTQDAEAIQAYRSLAFYWTSIQTGIGLINGDVDIDILSQEMNGEENEDENYNDFE